MAAVLLQKPFSARRALQNNGAVIASKSVKVMFVAPSAYVLSGLATWLDYLMPGLSAKGWEVTLGLVQGQRFHRPAEYLQEHPYENVVRIPCRSATAYGRCMALAKSISATKPDLVASVNIPDLFNAVSWLRMRRGKAPKCTMTIHGIQEDIVLDAAIFSGVIDSVIATNRLGCRLLEMKAGFDASRTFYAPCGASRVENALRRISSSEGTLRLLFSGRLSEREKRVCDLVHIVEGLRISRTSFQLTIAGDGEEASDIQEKLTEYIADGSVRFLGSVPREHLMQNVYPKTDALIITSPSETGPLVAWEAFAAGVVVVSSNFIGSGLEQALIHEKTALMFDVGDIDTAVIMLKRLSVEHGLHERLSRNAATLWSQRYCEERSISAWDCALRKSVDLPHLPPTRPPNFVPKGRLDRLIGFTLADKIRDWIGGGVVPTDPSGEWPHTLSSASEPERFLQLASEWDGVRRMAMGRNVKDN